MSDAIGGDWIDATITAEQAQDARLLGFTITVLIQENGGILPLLHVARSCPQGRGRGRHRRGPGRDPERHRSVGISVNRFHDLRHSCASLMLAQGIPARTVVDILGHSQVAITRNRYTHVPRGAHGGGGPGNGPRARAVSARARGL